MGNSKTETAKSGSGFFVTEDIVATNFHVIKDTDEGVAKIIGQDKLYDVLGIVGVDEKNDLALLKIKGIKGKPLILNKDDSTAIGDEVFAVGNPKGLEGTFSQGIVSSIRKSEKINLLQITASISEGSSGGAVLNDKGEVVGVAVGAIESGQSLNFAIPVSLLRSLVSNQTSLKSLGHNNNVAENRVQSSRKIEPKQPINLPTIKPAPQRKSKIHFKSPDLVEENLFGNIKTIKESTYIPEKKFDEWTMGETVSATTQRYNLEGYKEYSEEIIYSEREISNFIALNYIYNNGKDLDLPFAIRWLYYYDYLRGIKTQENYTKCASCSIFELEKKILIKYEEGEQTRFNPDGKAFWKIIRKIGNDSRVTVENFDEDGKLYDKEIIYKNNVGEVKEKWSRLKNNKDQLELSAKIITTETQKQLKETYVCVKEKDFSCGKVTIRDKSTKLILREEYVTAEILKNDYEFDSNGNWTKKTEYQQVKKFGKTSFEPTKVVVREISYY
jgi:hypothetical protein